MMRERRLTAKAVRHWLWRARTYGSTRELLQFFLKPETVGRSLVFEWKLTQPLHIGRNRVDRFSVIGNLKAAFGARDFHS